MINVFTVAETEPTSLVATALSPELCEAVKLEQPPAILFKKIIDDGIVGLCFPENITSQGEVVIEERYQWARRTLSIPSAQRCLIEIYLHEVAHRLTPGCSHNAVFATVNYILFLRASALHAGTITSLSLYDFYDHSEGHKIGMVDAFAFIYKIANELAHTPLSAEKLNSVVQKKWDAYQAEVIRRPARAQAKAEAKAALKMQLREAEQAKWMWAIAAAAISTVLTTALFKLA